MVLYQRKRFFTILTTMGLLMQMDTGYMSFEKPVKPKTKNKYIIIGDRVEEVRELVVHQFTMGDVEDPDLYAAQPLIEWEKTDKGQWVMNNAYETPSWYRTADVVTYGYKYQIRAKFAGPALTEYLLRYHR